MGLLARLVRRKTLKPETSSASGTILKINNIEVMYHEVILVLKGVSIDVPQGGIVALLGANGAGKSTTLKSISGLLNHEDGEVTDGSIEFMGEKIHHLAAEEIAKRGIFQIIEGRRVFEHLTVEENLRVGAHLRGNGSARKERLEMVYHYFPRLVERRNVLAGFISGGEQQMTVIGRALMPADDALGGRRWASLLLIKDLRYYHPIEQGREDSTDAGRAECEAGPYRGSVCICLRKWQACDA
jgi:ABC-type sugar transport system ATPase subunit